MCAYRVSYVYILILASRFTFELSWAGFFPLLCTYSGTLSLKNKIKRNFIYFYLKKIRRHEFITLIVFNYRIISNIETVSQSKRRKNLQIYLIVVKIQIFSGKQALSLLFFKLLLQNTCTFNFITVSCFYCWQLPKSYVPLVYNFQKFCITST